MNGYLLIPVVWWLGMGAAWAEPGRVQAGAGLTALTGMDMLQWLFGLLMVIGTILGCAWLLRKFGNLHSGATPNLRVVGGISLGAREKVVLLQVGRKQLVLGVTPGRIETLCVLEEDETVPNSSPETPGRGGLSLGEAKPGGGQP